MTTPDVTLSTRSHVSALKLTPNAVELLDQNALPHEVRYLQIQTADAMADAITTMQVRGAPAIGIAGAYGVVLGARTAVAQGLSIAQMRDKLARDIASLNDTRPTAVNLSWALGLMKERLSQHDIPQVLLEALTRLALQIHQEDIAACERIGDFGASLIPEGAGVLTHCNAGALATGGYGTALGVVRSAYEKDKTLRVYADETRPRLQGARLTTWELLQDGIPVTLISDNMSGSLMQAGQIDRVVVGADRIAANGDTANKIGTYNLAIIARAHHVPFYVAAPLSTIDMSLSNGDQIPIEARDTSEISTVNGLDICPAGTDFYNPAFDVTPAAFISAIITEKGLALPPYEQSLAGLFV